MKAKVYKGSDYLWKRLELLARVSSMFPRRQFMARYTIVYNQIKPCKLRGGIAMDTHFRTSLDNYHDHKAVGPAPWNMEEFFPPRLSIGSYPHSSFAIAIVVKPRKLLNTYQVRRLLLETR